MSRQELDLRRRISKLLLHSDKLFAPALGESPESASEVETMEAIVDEVAVDNAETHSTHGIKTEHKNLAKQADELMQAHIREEADDPFASDDEYPDITALIKKKE